MSSIYCLDWIHVVFSTLRELFQLITFFFTFSATSTQQSSLIRTRHFLQFVPRFFKIVRFSTGTRRIRSFQLVPFRFIWIVKVTLAKPWKWLIRRKPSLVLQWKSPPRDVPLYLTALNRRTFRVRISFYFSFSGTSELSSDLRVLKHPWNSHSQTWTNVADLLD